MDPVNTSVKFEVRIASPVPEIMAIGVLGFGVGVANHNFGEEEVEGGQGWYRSKERW